MATEKRLIDADDVRIKAIPLEGLDGSGIPYEVMAVPIICIDEAETVDAVPVDDIKLLRILIDNEGVPEVKLQIGDRYFILRTDPVDVREVVHGRWIGIGGNRYTRVSQCSNCCAKYDFMSNYCPNCGAKMDGERRTE